MWLPCRTVLLAAALSLASCAYKGPQGAVTAAQVVESQCDGGVTVRARTPSGSGRSVPVDVWLAPGLVRPTDRVRRMYTLAVRATDGRMLHRLGFDREMLRVPRPPEGGRAVPSVAHVWVPLMPELLEEDDGTSVTLHAILSIDVAGAESIAFDFRAELVRDVWAKRPRIDSRPRVVGVLLYPAYGLWRDVLDVPFTAISRLGVGTTFPPRRGRREMARRWYLMPVLCVVSPLGGPGILACAGYGYTITPVDVALFRSGVDDEFVKWREKLTVELPGGEWDDPALATVEDLERSLTFFPNWKFIANERIFLPGDEQDPSLRVHSIRVRRIDPVPEEW